MATLVADQRFLLRFGMTKIAVANLDWDELDYIGDALPFRTFREI